MTVTARLQVLNTSRGDRSERPMGPAPLCVSDQLERARGKPQPLPGVEGDEDGFPDGRPDKVRPLTPSAHSATAQRMDQSAAAVADRAGVRLDREHLPACRTEDARAHERVDHLDRRRLGDHLVPHRGQPRRCSDALLFVVVVVVQLPATRGSPRSPDGSPTSSGQRALGTHAQDPCVASFDPSGRSEPPGPPAPWIWPWLPSQSSGRCLRSRAALARVSRKAASSISS